MSHYTKEILKLIILHLHFYVDNLIMTHLGKHIDKTCSLGLTCERM